MLTFRILNRTTIQTSHGTRDMLTVDVSFDRSYVTAGMPVNVRDCGMKKAIDSISVLACPSGYLVAYHRVSDTDHRLKVFLTSSATGAQSFTGTALAAHGHTVEVAQLADTTALEVVYWNPTTGKLTINGSGASGVENTSAITAGTPAGSISTSPASVATEVAAGTDLSTLVNVTCAIVGW